MSEVVDAERLLTFNSRIWVYSSMVVGGKYGILYQYPVELDRVLQDYRLFFVLDFIQDTTKDLLTEYQDRMTERERQVCMLLARDKIIAGVKRHTMNVPLMRRHIAMMLYEVFKVCRKLPLQDKEVVVGNFNQLRIEK